MKIAIAADHAGFSLKDQLREQLRRTGHEVVDFGTHTAQSTDYPDYAAAVAQSIAEGRAERGVLVCSTGVGMAIAANKVPGIRAALAVNAEEVQLTRLHNDANVLTIGSKLTSPEEAARLTQIFLDTPFDGGERHLRRLAKISELERPIVGEEIATK